MHTCTYEFFSWWMILCVLSFCQRSLAILSRDVIRCVLQAHLYIMATWKSMKMDIFFCYFSFQVHKGSLYWFPSTQGRRNGRAGGHQKKWNHRETQRPRGQKSHSLTVTLSYIHIHIYIYMCTYTQIHIHTCGFTFLFWAPARPSISVTLSWREPKKGFPYAPGRDDIL